MVQTGFEPKITFICPLCSKEVNMVFERGISAWTSEHSACLNYSVIRSIPKFLETEMEVPLVFMILESDFSIKEAVEGLRSISKDENEQFKKLKLETGMKRLESKLGFVDKHLSHIMGAIKGGSFGVKIVSGKDIYALLWKSGEKYFGLGDDRCRERQNVNIFLASSSLEEAHNFMSYWIHYWEASSS